MSTEAELLTINRVENSLNAKHGIIGFQVVSKHRGVLSASLGPDVDAVKITTFCNALLAHDRGAAHQPHLGTVSQTTSVIPGTGVVHVQQTPNFCIAVLTPPGKAIDVESLILLMDDHLARLERQHAATK